MSPADEIREFFEKPVRKYVKRAINKLIEQSKHKKLMK